MSTTTLTVAEAGAPVAKGGKVQFRLHASDDRGHADHGWLKTYHTFSFASWYDPRHSGFGPLRVINEDRVDAGTGFGRHPHREFEIFSYIVDGELEHQDSMGNKEVMRRGDCQMTSAGTGIAHSEYNRGKEEVHFLQIWAKPSQYGLRPQYYTRHFTDAEKRDVLVPIVAPIGADSVTDTREGSGPAPIHAGVTAYASILTPGKSIAHNLSPNVRRAYVHLVTTKYRAPGQATAEGDAQIKIAVKDGEEVALKEGDGVYVDVTRGGEIETTFTSTGGREAEFVVFAMTE